MKRITDFFKEPTASVKKPKVLAENTASTSTADPAQPSESATSSSAVNTDSATTSTDSATSKKGFMMKWLNEDNYKNWLTYDSEKNLMFCSMCKNFNKKNPMTFGCCNFRTSTLTRHLSGQDHRDALTDSNLRHTMEKQVKTVFDEKHEAIVSAMACVFWLTKEKVATIKYDSLVQLLKFRGCPCISKLYSGENATYLSHTTAEEFQDVFSHMIENKLKEKLLKAKMVSLMCDESTDIAVAKKMVVYCRLALDDDELTPETVFLDNVTVEDGTAKTIHQALKDCAVHFGLPMENVMFLGSDGASVMTGSKSGVAARMKEENGHLLNVHCMAHKLALCTSQAANEVPFLKKYKDTLTNLFYYFKHSAQRTANLKAIEDVLDDKQLKIKEIHAVRWFAFYNALEAIYHSWSSLVTYFEQEKRAEKGGSAKGFLTQVSQFEFVAVTYFLMDVIPILTKLSLIFQKETLDISIVQPVIESTKSQLEHLVANHGPYTQKLMESVQGSRLELRNHTVTATVNQKTHFKDIQQKFVAGIVAQLDRRFPPEDTSVIGAMSVLGLRGINFVELDKLDQHGNDKIETLTTHYGHSTADREAVVSTEETLSEWNVLKRLVKQQMYPTDSLLKLWKLIHQYHQEEFPNLMKLAVLALICPLQTADCERGFSVQNDLKTAVRNRLSSSRLSKLMRIAVDKTSLEEFDFNNAVSCWRNAKSRRLFQNKQ